MSNSTAFWNADGSRGPLRSRRRGAAALAALALIASTACSDNSDDGGSSADATTTSTKAAAAAPSGSSGPSGDTAASGEKTSGNGGVSEAASSPSAGCDAAAPQPVALERQTVMVDSAERWWLMTVPDAASAKKPLSLVVDFHGLMEGADVHAKMSDFSGLAQEKGFFVATPHGTGTPVRWGVGGGPEGAADQAFVTAMLSDLEARYCIDTNRVYATGLSNGAMMSSVMACEQSDVFAAVAPIAGVMAIPGCQPTRRVPMMSIHGTADPILHFDGTIGSIPGLGGAPAVATTAPATTAPVDLDGPGYPANVAAWAKRNGCEPEPTDTDVTENVILRTYECPAGADVEFYVVKGGGHSWPGSEFSKAIATVVGPTTFDIDASELAWEFFTRHALAD